MHILAHTHNNARNFRSCGTTILVKEQALVLHPLSFRTTIGQAHDAHYIPFHSIPFHVKLPVTEFKHKQFNGAECPILLDQGT